MNASDTRSGADVEDRVRAALESDSLRGSGRPTLVLLDEIDGATGGEGGHHAHASFIHALVRLVERGAGAPRRARGGRARAKPLLRPIICVCNDLYAPALRPLRPLARVLRYTRAPPSLMARRLAEICAREQLRCDTRSLTLLCDVTQGDLRSCLHALEMIRAGGGEVSERAILDAAVGLKESGVSLTALWPQLFHGVDRRSASYVRAGAEAGRGRPGSAVQALVHELARFGEFERLAHGCFEHYLRLRVPDDGWARYAQAHDWLHFANTLSQRSFGGGGGQTAFELLGFLPWAFVPWHLLFANVANPLPEQPPRVDYEQHLRRTSTEELVRAVRALLSPAGAAHFGRQSVATELGPALVRILSPDIKLTNQTASGESRAALRALVDVMLSLGMSFQPDRTEEGILVHRLNPTIDAFGAYDGHARCDVGPTRHGARQLVQRELEAEAARRRAPPAAPAARRELEPAVLQPARVANEASVDFFGRPIRVEAPPLEEAVKEFRVFYRYHEGYSNAVRKNLRLASLV